MNRKSTPKVSSLAAMAQAWHAASIDLQFDFISPYTVIDEQGNPHTCSGLVVDEGKQAIAASRYNIARAEFWKVPGLRFLPHFRSSSRMGSSVKPKLFSAGECPVCADSGAVLLLRRADSTAIVLFCPLCGVAWTEPPIDRIDEISSLELVAPHGVVLPTEAEAIGSGIRLVEVPAKDWFPLLEEFLNGRSTS